VTRTFIIPLLSALFGGGVVDPRFLPHRKFLRADAAYVGGEKKNTESTGSSPLTVSVPPQPRVKSRVLHVTRASGPLSITLTVVSFDGSESDRRRANRAFTLKSSYPRTPRIGASKALAVCKAEDFSFVATLLLRSRKRRRSPCPMCPLTPRIVWVSTPLGRGRRGTPRRRMVYTGRQRA